MICSPQPDPGVWVLMPCRALGGFGPLSAVSVTSLGVDYTIGLNALSGIGGIWTIDYLRHLNSFLLVSS